MRSNIKDVARRAGVSIATVSHVINNTRYVSDEKRRKVLSAIEGLNYKPNTSARSLRSQRSSNAAALVCSKYAQRTPRLLNRLLQCLTEIAAEQQCSLAVLFADPNELLRICREQNEYDHVFVITDNVSPYTAMLKDLENIHYFDMGLFSMEGGNPLLKSEPSVFYTGSHYYMELSNLISDHDDGGTCFLISLEQNKIMRDLLLHNINYKNIFQHTRVIRSEVSAAYIELIELMSSENYRHIYLTDYKFALGAVKLLLVKPELINSNVSISFFSYDCCFEDFGLPILEIPFLLSKSVVEEATGSVFHV